MIIVIMIKYCKNAGDDDDDDDDDEDNGKMSTMIPCKNLHKRSII